MFILLITEGERVTLTLWFSRDATHDEDAKLLQSLSECTFSNPKGPIPSHFPLQASNNMYWFPPEEASRFQSGFNICSARLHILGFDFSSSNEESYISALDSSDTLKLLMEPLHLAHGDELLVCEFVNILHALQVVQFYYWKALELKAAEVKHSSIHVIPLSESLRQKIACMKGVILKDLQLTETFFGHSTNEMIFQRSFGWFGFSAAIVEWEAYIRKLQKEMLTSLPYWRTHQSIFSLVSHDNELVE